MARWDEILSLPVQNPPTLEFSAGDLLWSKVEGWRDNIDRVALIPFARVDDFVRGESSNKDCPTRFHVEARRRRPPEMAYKPKVDGILEYILYWCSFGPDDHRKGGIVRPSRSTYVPKKKSAGRPNTKRGCTCHFIVKRLIAEPTVALIIYNQDKHVDKKGLPCHGPQDKKAAGTRAMFAPYISEDLRLRVLSLLYVGVSVETIMQRHKESVDRQGGPCNRDDLLTHRYVRRQERSIRRSTYKLDADDAVSISLWVENHQSHVFFFEDFSNSDPFVLGIQTEWQLQQMIRFGNRSLLASDSRFGTNKLKYPVHSLLVFNSDNKAIPVAWIISPRFASGDVYKWMMALYKRVHTKDPTWKLAGFIVDDPSVDILAIRDVFQCSVLICFWRVRHAWHKNLVKKCSETQMRVEISKRLGQAVHAICRGHETVDLFEDFMEDFIDGSDFMDYFKAIWYPRIGMWTTALKTLPLASQETCAAMEFYHNQLKLRLLNEKDPNVYQRADWLVDKLGTKVHSFFWLDEYSDKDGFARYWKDEWVSGLTSWRKALKIPDSDVVFEGGCAKVINKGDQDRAHVVRNPGSEFSICDCSWAQMGNLCEHVFKVIIICRLKGSALPSTSLLQYNKALNNMLSCPPHDSLIRDHAVSLAVSVQMLLNALVGPDSSQTIVDLGQQQVGLNSANQDRSLVNENCHTIEKMSSDNNNGQRVGCNRPGDLGGDLRSELIGGAVSSNGICGESAKEEIPRAEMDIDPSSLCTSTPGLFSVNGVLSSDGFFENEERVCINAGLDASENLLSKDSALPNQNGFEDSLDKCQESVMDVELPSIDIPVSGMEFLEQRTVCPHQNTICSNDAAETALQSKTLDADPPSNKASLSVSMPTELHTDDAVEASGIMEGNETIEMKENASPSRILSSADKTFPLEGVQGSRTHDSNLGHDTQDAVDELGTQPILLETCPPKSSFKELQTETPVEPGGCETSSSEKQSVAKSFGSRCEDKNGDCHEKEIGQLEGDNCATVAKETVSGESAHASPERTVS
ncbi:uncharacterized protein LOC131166868 [Malania oleifera]|uniref:uncharacterized protein LOC131166868 n=1 Tax=Malania oleifera TaxID=397392 RepID=UPI0025AE9AE1|nr:uncharacterized protein LOC131166868 [Malania oleifera]